MATKRKRKPAAKPHLLLHLYNTTWLFSKHPHLKHHYIPLTPEQQAQYIPTDGENTLDLGLELNGVDLDKVQAKKINRSLKRISSKQFRRACHTFCKAPDMLLNPGPGWIILLSCLLSSVMDLAIHDLPNAPIIQLKGVGSMIPKSLAVLLSAIHGPDELRGKKFQVKRPSCIRAFTPLGAAAPSTQPEDYFGGYVKQDKMKYFWVPLRNTAVAVSANVPQTAWNEALKQSHLALPIFCSAAPKWPTRTLLIVDGTPFQTIDPDMLKKLKKQRKRIYLILTSYGRWLRRKKHWKQCVNHSTDFYPKSQNGRFVITTASDEVRTISLALAVFKQFLHYASKKKWITHEEAHSYLQEAWTQVLPESCPKADTTPTSASGSWDDPNTFWTFFAHYLQENQQHISLAGPPCAPDVIAAPHKLADSKFLIIPREQLTQAYVNDLQLKNIPLPSGGEKKWGTALQRAILDWRMPVKTEGTDISWRYTFYDNQTPAGKRKIPCLAFPVDQLPAAIISRLSDWFGADFDPWISSAEARNAPEAEKVTENVESGDNYVS